MLFAVVSLTVLAAALGTLLGVANRVFRVENNPVVAEIEALMPGSNCGQCGFAGCAGAAAAIADGSAPATCCPPGGKALASAIAAKLGLALDLSGVAERRPEVAGIAEEFCIGCTRCIKVCPTDAILGGPKQMHSVLHDACTGCGSCVARCPTEAIAMQGVPLTLQQWVWPKPAIAA